MTGQNLARALFIIGFQAVPGVHELLGEQFIELFPEAIVDNHEPLDFLVRRPAGLFCRIGHVVMQVVHPKQGLELPRGFASAPIRADHDVRRFLSDGHRAPGPPLRALCAKSWQGRAHRPISLPKACQPPNRRNRRTVRFFWMCSIAPSLALA